MDSPSRLELAVMRAIAAQAPEHSATINQQIDLARVATRENTGAGFFTTFHIADAPRLDGLGPPVGWVTATVVGLSHGLGFVLWVRDGVIHQLEGYAQGAEDTSGLDFERIEFRDVEAR